MIKIKRHRFFRLEIHSEGLTACGIHDTDGMIGRIKAKQAVRRGKTYRIIENVQVASSPEAELRIDVGKQPRLYSD